VIGLKAAMAAFHSIIDHLWPLLGDHQGILHDQREMHATSSVAWSGMAGWRDGARFVSYHYADRPELNGRFDDATEVIKSLTNL
jgi:hypothetical protein